MIPLFKSHFSIGKSILKLSNSKEGGSDAVFDIAKENNLERVFLVEDSLTGFLESAKLSKELGIQLIFGLRLTACDSKTQEKKKDCHKVIVFAKNDDGCKLLNKIYSEAFSGDNPSIQMSRLKDIWEDKSLKLAIPFYDSFVFNNVMSFSNCAPVFSFTKPVFFLEDNNLPFDSLIRDSVCEFASAKNFETQESKTIYYKNREDFSAFQTYKCVCNRGGWGGRSVSLQKPNLDHCGSKEFCFESWREQQ